MEDCNTGDVIGMLLLNLEEGTLTVYKNNRRLGVMKDGLSGLYCWYTSVWGGTAVTLKREEPGLPGLHRSSTRTRSTPPKSRKKTTPATRRTHRVGRKNTIVTRTMRTDPADPTALARKLFEFLEALLSSDITRVYAVTPKAARTRLFVGRCFYI